MPEKPNTEKPNTEKLRPDKPKLKRFYKAVATDRVEAGWRVLLDGKPIRTPGRAVLTLPSHALAKAVAAEWERQGEEVNLQAMPLMQFSCAALDYATPHREEVIAEAVEYAATDALCYRAEEQEALAERQRREWQPHLDWLREEYGIVLRVATGIMPVRQEETALQALRERLEALEVFPLTAVWLITRHCASPALALAAHAGRLSPQEAFAVSRLEEAFQNERWGEDDEVRARRESVEAEMAAIGRFLAVI